VDDEATFNQSWVDKGWVFKGDTIEELASKLVAKNYYEEVVGVDPEGLAETIKNWNAYCAAGKDLEFGRNPETMEPINGPFYAMELIECQTNTDGGPERNKYCQTLNPYGEPIPRLYNCGELGSIWGALYNGGGNIPETYSTGFMAVEHALTLEPLT
jgi:predicted oxidoreductase